MPKFLTSSRHAGSSSLDWTSLKVVSSWVWIAPLFNVSEQAAFFPSGAKHLSSHHLQTLGASAVTSLTTLSLSQGLAIVHFGYLRLPVCGARQLFYFHLYHAVRNEANHLSEKIVIEHSEQSFQNHSVARYGSLVSGCVWFSHPEPNSEPGP